MFERIYAFFLRLYPARFRAAYEREALQLLRDRLCDETGVVRRARLGFDLVMDFAVGWRQSFVNGRRTARTAVPVESPGAPILFRLLEQEPTRPASFLFGTILSLAALGAFAFVLTHGRRYQPFAGSEDSTSPVESVLAQVNHAAGQGTPEPSASTAVSVRATGASSPADKQSGLPPPPPPPGAIAVDVRDRVVRTVAANLEDHYFDRPRAHAAAAMLLAHEGHGDYAALPVSDALAHRLTADIRQSTGDTHLEVVHSEQPLLMRAGVPDAQAEQRYRAMLLQQNCTIEPATMLPHNIGYLKLDSFPDPTVCHAQMEEALLRLNGASALIVDLRDNRGGTPEMVAYVASWLFDRPQTWFTPIGRDTTTPTLVPLAGSRLPAKPVYVLTSGQTISAAEQFTYDLKMLHRATVVGETTAGSAHVGTFERVDDHFGMGIPERPIINPYGVPDWEGKGIEPDVKVPASEALKAAEDLARAAIRRSADATARARDAHPAR